MSNKAKCSSELNVALQAILGALSSKITASKLKDPEYGNQLASIKSHITKVQKDINKHEVFDLTDKFIKLLKDDSAEELDHIIRTFKSKDENARFYKNTIRSIKTKGGLIRGLAAFFNRSLKAQQGEKVWASNYLETSFKKAGDRYKVDGEDALRIFDLFKKHQAGSQALVKEMNKKYGLNDDEIKDHLIEALVDGHTSVMRGSEKVDITELNVIGKVYKDFNNAVAARNRENGSPYRKNPDQLFRTRELWSKVDNMGKEEYREHMLNYFDFEAMFKDQKDLTDEKLMKLADKWINSRYNRLKKNPETTNSFAAPKDMASIYPPIFRSVGAEVDHFMTFQADNADLLNSAFGHLSDILIEGKKYGLHGRSMQGAVNQIKDITFKKAERIGITDPSFLMGHIDILAQKANLRPSPTKAYEAAWDPAVGAASDIISMTLVRNAPLRDLIFDKSFIPASIEASLTNRSTTLLWMRNMMQLMRHTLMNRGDFKALASFFEDMGVGLQMSYRDVAKGEFDAFRSAEIAQQHKVTKGIRNFAETISTLTGANRIHSAGRVFQAVNSNNLIQRMLKTDFDSLEPAAHFFLREAGITKADWETFQGMDMLEVSGMKLPDFKNTVVQAKGLEQSEDALRNLRLKYNTLMENMLDHLAASPTLHGLPPAVFNFGSDPITRLITKFWGINLTQYRNWLAVTQAATGLEPGTGNDITGFLQMANTGKGRWAMGKATAFMLTGGMMMTWIKDLVEGNTPRDFDIETAANALGSTGLFGVANMVMSSIIYNENVANIPISQHVRLVKKGLKLPFSDDPHPGSFLKDVRKLTPGLNLFLFDGIAHKAFREGFEDYKTDYDKMLEERGQKRLFKD